MTVFLYLHAWPTPYVVLRYGTLESSIKPTGDEMIHNYSGETIHFDIKYKKRASIAIYIDSYGNIEVQAPKGRQMKLY